MKNRTIEHINFIEAATEQIKKLNEELNIVTESLKTEEEQEVKLLHYHKYKSLFFFIGLLYKDLEAKIAAFIECYTCATIAGEKFSEQENKIYEKYIENNTSTFVLSNGKVETKDKNLFNMINTRFEGDRDFEKMEAFVKALKQNN